MLRKGNMKFDRICRICLAEKCGLKPIFTACIPNMIMGLAAVQVDETKNVQ